MRNNIVVSVFCPTYNHSDYIKQCLDSIVMQITKFQFEVFVQDDASTDNSQQIIRTYSDKHDFIIPVLHKENIFSKGGNLNEYVFNNARGEYIAICEGDDYWTDPYKLQKQVDYLDKNKEVSICCHWHENIDSNNKSNKEFWDVTKCPELFDTTDAIRGVTTHPNTWMFRNCNLKFPSVFTKIPGGDDPLLLMILNNGKGHCIKETMSAYRLHKESIWNPLSITQKTINTLIYNFNIHRFCKKNYDVQILKERKIIEQNFIYESINESSHFNIFKTIILQLFKYGIPKSFLIKLYFKYVCTLIKHSIKKKLTTIK